MDWRGPTLQRETEHHTKNTTHELNRLRTPTRDRPAGYLDLETTCNKSSWWWERDLHSESPDFKSSAKSTRPSCLHDIRADEAQTRTRGKPINNSLSGFLVAPPTRCAKRLSSAFANGLGFSKGSCKIQSIIMFTAYIKRKPIQCNEIHIRS